MKQKETNVWKKLLIDLPPKGYRLFRNERLKGHVKILRDREKKEYDAWVDCGLCDGAGDLIGYKIVTITQDMVGKTVAVFSSWETKVKKGRASKEQENFKDIINKDGGIAVIFKEGDEIK